MNREHEILVGVVAVQAQLITQTQLAAACAEWSGQTAASLVQILCQHEALCAEDLPHIEYLAERKLARFQGDLRASLADSPLAIRDTLASLTGMTLDSSAEEATLTIQEDSEEWGDIPFARSQQRYALNSLHAAGGIGEIWLAKDTSLQRDVAVKRLQTKRSPSKIAKMRFLREARITGKLDHPGVVPIYEICLDEETGLPYYSMRFLRGHTLSEAVRQYHARKKAPGSESQAFLQLLSSFCIVCNTVAYAHAKGIVHRDLKSDNVILGDYGEVVVIDWGLAKESHSQQEWELEEGADAEHDSTSDPKATRVGQVLGTPAYMAPEQAAGRLDLVGPAADIYGLCAILYEILCGQPPFSGSNAIQVLQAVQQESPRSPSDIVAGVPETLERICLQGLSKAPQDRQPSAESLAREVQAWISDLAERRQAEGERERFFALSLDLLAIIDESGRLRQSSPTWTHLLGYTPEQLADAHFLDFIHPEDRPALADLLQNIARRQTTGSIHARAKTQAGTHRWFSWNLTPITQEHNLYIVGRDITEIVHSKQLFEGVLQSAPDALVLIDSQGRIVMANKQMEAIFGYTQAELIGQPVEILIPAKYRTQHPRHVENFFATSHVRPMGSGLALRGQHKNGQEIAVEIALSPIQTEAGKLVAASVRDLTEWHRE